MARRFTKELNPEFLSRQLGDIRGRKASDLSVSAAGAGERGLMGLGMAPVQASAISQGAARDEDRALTDFDMRAAEQSRQERLTGEARTYKAGEDEKERAFREKMANLGYMFQGEQQSSRDRAAAVTEQQGAVLGGLFSLGGAAIKGYAMRGLKDKKPGGGSDTQRQTERSVYNTSMMD